MSLNTRLSHIEYDDGVERKVDKLLRVGHLLNVPTTTLEEGMQGVMKENFALRKFCQRIVYKIEQMCVADQKMKKGSYEPFQQESMDDAKTKKDGVPSFHPMTNVVPADQYGCESTLANVDTEFVPVYLDDMSRQHVYTNLFYQGQVTGMETPSESVPLRSQALVEKSQRVTDNGCAPYALFEEIARILEIAVPDGLETRKLALLVKAEINRYCQEHGNVISGIIQNRYVRRNTKHPITRVSNNFEDVMLVDPQRDMHFSRLHY